MMGIPLGCCLGGRDEMLVDNSLCGTYDLVALLYVLEHFDKYDAPFQPNRPNLEK